MNSLHKSLDVPVVNQPSLSLSRTLDRPDFKTLIIYTNLYFKRISSSKNPSSFARPHVFPNLREFLFFLDNKRCLAETYHDWKKNEIKSYGDWRKWWLNKVELFLKRKKENCERLKGAFSGPFRGSFGMFCKFWKVVEGSQAWTTTGLSVINIVT